MLLREQKEFKVSPELTLQEFELSSFKDEHQEQLDGRLFLRLVRGKKRVPKTYLFRSLNGKYVTTKKNWRNKLQKCR